MLIRKENIYPSFFLYLTLVSFFCFLFFSENLFSEKAKFIDKKISNIEFYGLKNLGTDELYEVILSRYDQPLEASAFNEDVRRLFDTGYFSNVIMRVELLKDGTLSLSYEVKEYPQISNISYIGLEELNTQDFIQKVKIKEDDFFSLEKIRLAAQAIKNVYIEKGLFQVEVWHKLSKVNPKTNRVKVFFIIDEGLLIPISKINILGTQRLNTNQIITILEQKEGADISDAPFDKDKFESDKQRILALAKSSGLLNAELDEEGTGYEIRWKDPSNKEKGRVVVINYKIIEGKRKFFGGYSIYFVPSRINKELNPPERLKKFAKDLKPIYKEKTLLEITSYSHHDIGDIFDQALFYQDRGQLQEVYARRGYVFAQVRPRRVDFSINQETLEKFKACLKVKNPKTKKQKQCKKEASWLALSKLENWLKENPSEANRPLRHIHFEISENNLAYVEDIFIRGNEKTKEEVIRREILVKKGQLFNSTLVNISRQRLINLQFFSEVNLQMRPGSSQNQMNIVFEIKEQPTGNIVVGGNYSESTGFALNMKLEEKNFRGTGESIGGSIDYGVNYRSISINKNIPWFYESCQDVVGSYWKDIQKKFNNSSSKEQIIGIAQELREIDAKKADRIDKYLAKFPKNSIENIDRIKVYIRNVLAKEVYPEEQCYRNVPRPWSLGYGIFVSSRNYETQPISVGISGQQNAEIANYTANSYGVSISTSHSLGHRWSHSHTYIPKWTSISKPSALASDYQFLRARQGVQFQSNLINSLQYSSLDNPASPTQGNTKKFRLQTTGSYLGGNDHYNRLTFSSRKYFWWFDFSFGGTLTNRTLQRWRVVQALTFSTTLTQISHPIYENQNNQNNPYIESQDKLFLGGVGNLYDGRLRGYDIQDNLYPTDWRAGSQHRVLFGTELRIPIEPRFLWFATFIDAGSLYNSLGDFQGDQKTRLENVESALSIQCSQRNANQGPYSDCYDWNDPRRTVLSNKNIALNRFLYSWGYGLRVQIPIFPLRIYYAQRLHYTKGSLQSIPGHTQFNLIFGIGDYQF